MSRGTMLYMRIGQGVMKDLFRAGVKRELLQNKSSLTLICEKLVEWAASYAANGAEAEAIIEQRECQDTYQRISRERRMGKNADMDKVMLDAKVAKDVVEKRLTLEEAEERLKDYFKERSTYGKLMKEE